MGGISSSSEQHLHDNGSLYIDFETCTINITPRSIISIRGKNVFREIYDEYLNGFISKYSSHIIRNDNTITLYPTDTDIVYCTILGLDINSHEINYPGLKNLTFDLNTNFLPKSGCIDSAKNNATYSQDFLDL